jgi:hypothetical protein
MKAFAKVIFLFHDVGKAFMRDIKKINKGLHVSNLQKMSTDALSSVILMLLVSWNVGLLNIFTLLIALPSLQYFILPCHLVQQNRRTCHLCWLLYWFNFLLFLFHLCSSSTYPKLSVRLHWKFKTDCNNNCNKTNTKIISHSYFQINLCIGTHNKCFIIYDWYDVE